MRFLQVFTLTFFFGFIGGSSCSWVLESREKPSWRTEDGGTVRWERLPVRWAFLCGTDEIPEFREGINWWNERYGDVFVEVNQESACLCGTTYGDCPDMWVAPGIEDPTLTDAGLHRFAATFMITQDGYAKSAAIRYYDEQLGKANEACMVTIARHEAGHVLGLMHSGYEGCLMYPSIDEDLKQPKSICPGEERLFKQIYGRE